MEPRRFCPNQPAVVEEPHHDRRELSKQGDMTVITVASHLEEPRLKSTGHPGAFLFKLCCKH